MKENFAKNINFLRKKKGLTQLELATDMGFKQSALSGYEKGISTPNFNDLMKIIKYFDITASEMIETDLQNVHLNKNDADKIKQVNVHPIVHPNVHLNPKNETFQPTFNLSIAAESAAEYGTGLVPVPITDISVAAGGGVYNQDYVSNVDALQLPVKLLKRNCTYLCVKIKGASMAPTLQDGGYVIIRLLDKGDWAKMPDERVFVVADTDGKAYLKRVKNRFKNGFIVLRSDNPDQATYPNFNLETAEINTIWCVEWYLSAKLPNIHDEYYSRLQRLEDKFDDLLKSMPKINHR